MPPFRHQALDFLYHAAAKLDVARAERGDNALRVFAEQPEGPAFQTLLHRVDPVNQSTPHAASGVTAATAVTGAYPKWSTV